MKSRAEEPSFPTLDHSPGRNRPSLFSDPQSPESASNADSWALVPALFRSPGACLPSPWAELFGPLYRGTVDDLVIVGQIGQSIDGRIATVTGHSKYINGP